MQCDFFLVTQKGNIFSHLCIINNYNYYCHDSDVVNKINDIMIKKQKAVSSLFIRGFTVPLKLSINNRFKTPICPEEDLFALLPT